MRTGSLESLRELNRLRVVETLRERGTASRAEIARVTGCPARPSRASSSDLQAHGLIVEHSDPDAPASMATGPPADAALARPLGGRGGRHRLRPRPHPRRGLRPLAHGARRGGARRGRRPRRRGLARHRRRARRASCSSRPASATSDVIGVGMALSGPIDHDRGAVRPTAILPGWEGLAVAAEMSRRLGDLPVHLDNDANLGALAEVTLGAARDARNAVYVMVSSGIGAGLIVDGRPYRGGGGMAGEIGHVLVDESGPICRCGNRGCLETYISGPALSRPAAAQPRRGAERRRDRPAGPRRRRRLPARDRRRRARARPRGRRDLQRAQPRHGRRGRRPG